MKRFIFILLVLLIGLTGCQKTAPLPINRRPMALIEIVSDITIGTEVILDGSKSSDADGDALKYRWKMLGKPTFSEIMFTTTLDSPKAKFIPDQPGYYVFSLVVNDSKVDSEMVLLTINVDGVIAGETPQIDSFKYSSGKIGKLLTLDASSCYVANDSINIDFAWDFAARPEGSLAQLTTTNQPATSFVPDIPGIYLLRLIIVKDGVTSDTAIFSVDVPKEIYDLEEKVFGAYKVQITWKTDLPTTTVLKYGLDYLNMTEQVVMSELVTEHIVTLDDLKPNSLYYYVPLSYDENGNEYSLKEYYYNYSNFATAEYNSIDIDKEINDIIYDEINHKVYVLDISNKQLLVINPDTYTVENTCYLKFVPQNVCLAPDRNALYIVNYGNTYITEIDLTTLTSTKEIFWPAPSGEYTAVIHYNAGSLFIKDKSRGLWVLNLDTLQYQGGNTSLPKVTNFTVTEDNQYMYGWDVVNGVVKVYKLDISSGDINLWQIADESSDLTFTDQSGYARLVPPFLIEDHNIIAVGKYILAMDDLKNIRVDNSYSNVLTVDPLKKYIFTESNIYDAATLDIIGTMTYSPAKAVVDKNDTIFILRRHNLDRLFYDVIQRFMN